MNPGYRFFLLVCLSVLTSVASAQFLGFGSVSNGAADCQGFETYHVTSLANSGPGTFRDGVSAGCRLVVFDVAGDITLTDTLLLQQSFLTVDGSSAPAPGITIVAPYIRFVIEASGSIGAAHDIIIGHLRVVGAGGDVESADILELDGQSAAVYNVILHHITAVSSSDGAFDVWGEVHDVTLSHNLIRDTIKSAHFSRSVQARERFTIHRNVYARNNERQLRMRYNNRMIDFSNNVIYGWGWMESGGAGLDLPSDAGYTPSINVENNIYHYVPSKGNVGDGIKLNSSTFPGDIFFSGNLLPAGEDDAVSTAPRTPIPAYAQVQKLATDQLADDVVPCAGMKYATQEELDLLQQISTDLGGSGASSCPVAQPAVRPAAPTNLDAN